MASLSLFLLGPLRVECDGAPVEISRHKAAALLAYLAVTGESHTREALATLLWPESDQTHGRTALRGALWTLKQAVGEPCLQIKREYISLDPRAYLRTDLGRFHDCLAACRSHGHSDAYVCPDCLRPLAEAVSLYRDDFLAGFSLRDSPAFGQWQRHQAEQLRDELTAALKRLVQGHSAMGQFEPAIAHTRRWLALDPLHEPAHRQLMRLLAWAGQRPAALAQYEDCLRLLVTELDLPPQDETTQLYQAIRDEELSSPSVAPAPTPHFTWRHNLPPQPTSFFGREKELAQVTTALEDPDYRLLTLVGAGGIGKTRLALQATEMNLAAFLNGVYLVPLAATSSASLIPSTIAASLGFSFHGRESPQTQLLHYLRKKQLLLLLDNFEHLLEGSKLLVEILDTAPEVKLLLTSRQRLNLRQEWLLDLQGLDYPQNGVHNGIEGYPAVQLFLHGARRVRTGFTLTEGEKPALVRICQLVEGMPLALELAAAWVRTHSCGEILREIERNVVALSTSLRDVPARHRSMRAVFDHSWGLLPEKERDVFHKLAVFRGGFRLEAAAEVAGAIPGILAALVDKSLLQRSPTGRYHTLEVVRQHAADKLRETDQEQVTRDRHCAYYAGFLQRREQPLRAWGQKEALEEIEEEIENVRAGWNWGVARGKVKEIARLLESLHQYYYVRGLYEEGQEVFWGTAARLMKEGGGMEESTLLGRILARQGVCCRFLGQYETAVELMQKSLSILPDSGYEAERAFSLNELGVTAVYRGAFAEARQHLQEALALCRKAGDRWGYAKALNNLGIVTERIGEYDEAKQLFQESLALRREMGDLLGIANSLNNLGVMAGVQGEYNEAKRLFRESLALRRGLGDQEGIAASLLNLGKVARLFKEYEEAKHLFQESLTLRREIGFLSSVAISLSNLALARESLGEYTEAKQLLQEALAVYTETDDPRGMANVLNMLGFHVHRLREFGEAKGYFLRALRMAIEIQSVPFALESVVGMAKILTGLGREEQALELLSLVQNHPACAQDTKDATKECLCELESQLPPGIIARCLEKGKSRKLEEVVEEILAERGF